jgi:hypothetical protein
MNALHAPFRTPFSPQRPSPQIATAVRRGTLGHVCPAERTRLGAGGIVMFLVIGSGRGRNGCTLPRCGWGRL